MAETPKIVSGFGLRVHPDPAFGGRRAPRTNTHAKAPFDTELKTKCEALANDIIQKYSSRHYPHLIGRPQGSPLRFQGTLILILSINLFLPKRTAKEINTSPFNLFKSSKLWASVMAM